MSEKEHNKDPACFISFFSPPFSLPLSLISSNVRFVLLVFVVAQLLLSTSVFLYLIGPLCLEYGKHLFKNAYKADLSRAPLNRRHEQLPRRLDFSLAVAVAKKELTQQYTQQCFLLNIFRCERDFSRELCSLHTAALDEL